MISFVRSFCLLAAIGEVVHSFFLSFSLSSQVVVGPETVNYFPRLFLLPPSVVCCWLPDCLDRWLD